jgi:hypothetical protein
VKLGAIDKENLPRAQMQIAELEAKLGPDVESAIKPGRPKKYIRITKAELERIKEQARNNPEGLLTEDQPGYWAPAEVERRAKVMREKFKEGGGVSEEASAVALKELMEMDRPEDLDKINKANEALGEETPNERTKATDDAKAVGGADKPGTRPTSG